MSINYYKVDQPVPDTVVYSCPKPGSTFTFSYEICTDAEYIQVTLYIPSAIPCKFCDTYAKAKELPWKEIDDCEKFLHDIDIRNRSDIDQFFSVLAVAVDSNGDKKQASFFITVKGMQQLHRNYKKTTIRKIMRIAYKCKNESDNI